MHDYIYYIQTILDAADEIYTDDIQNDYDTNDEYQGCQSWKDYQEDWN